LFLNILKLFFEFGCLTKNTHTFANFKEKTQKKENNAKNLLLLSLVPITAVGSVAQLAKARSL